MAIEFYADTWLSGEPIYLTDMDRCQPASALHPEPGPGLWRTLEYEMDALSGVMIMAGPETAAPDVTYPLTRIHRRTPMDGVRKAEGG